MASLIKILAIVVVISALGAVQFALPWLSDSIAVDISPTASHSTKTKLALALEYESETEVNATPMVEDYSDVQQGSLFFVSETEDKTLFQHTPLLDTQLKLNVTGMVARATLTQKFVNQSDDWVNGIYVFPLPSGAAVDHLEMHIGERRIEGQIKPKQVARRVYQEAKDQGKKAALLEQNRPNLFTSNVANIGPGEHVSITIEYQQLVHFDSGRFQLRFPMTITPRYSQGVSDGLHTESDSTGQQTGEISQQAVFSNEQANVINISARIDAGFELHRIESESHHITSRKLADWIYQIELEHQVVANRDFVLSWFMPEGETPKAAHFSQQFNGEYFGLMMILPPTVDNDDAHLIAKDMTLVLDTSGSMAGKPLREAKRAIRYAISALSEKDRFNIVEFNSHAKALWSYSRRANSENKQSAIEFINGLESNGGTNMHEALNLAMRPQTRSGNDAVEQIIFVTDGSVGNDTALLTVIRQKLANKRLFTVGIGAAPNGYFMQEAAVAGRGTFTFIGSIDVVDAKMQALFEKIQRPVLTELTTDFAADVEVFPSKIPDLYAGEPILLTYKSAEPVNDVYLFGETNTGSWWSKHQNSDSQAQVGVNVLWARNKIQQLSRDRLIVQDKTSFNQAIEDVALRHHIISEFTSLVAVDVTPTALAISKDTQIANNSAQTPSHKAGVLPRTSTDGALRIKLGIFFMGVALCFLLRRNRV